MHNASCIMHHASCIMHHASSIMHHKSSIIHLYYNHHHRLHHPSSIIHCLSCIMHHASSIMHHKSSMHYASRIKHPASQIIHHQYAASEIAPIVSFRFLLRFENLLQKVDCRVTLPYWDWSLFSGGVWRRGVDDIWSNKPWGLGGSGKRTRKGKAGCVRDGRFASKKWRMTPSARRQCLRRSFSGKVGFRNNEQINVFCIFYILKWERENVKK